MNNNYILGAALAWAACVLSACGGGDGAGVGATQPAAPAASAPAASSPSTPSTPSTPADPAASTPAPGVPGVGPFTLSVSVSGSGSVRSTPSGIVCGAVCTASSFSSGAAVTLSATPSPGLGATFTGWGGACSGTGACVVSMSASRSVTATFEIATPRAGVSYYVSPTGNDAANGLSLSSPWRTINKAVGAASAGDTIELRAGSYNENVVIRRAGHASAWITLRGYNGERPVLRGTGTGPTVYFYNTLCDEDDVGSASGNTSCFESYWVLQGLEIQGSASGGGDGNAIKIDTARVRLQGNRLCCSAADVVKLVRTANDVEILDNEIWQDERVTPFLRSSPSTDYPRGRINAQGIDIVGADRTRVAGNHVHDVKDVGIYAKGNARNTVFENNRLVNLGADPTTTEPNPPGGPALMLGQSTDADRLADGVYESYDGIIRNNVVVSTAGACFAVSSSFNARVYNNSCYDTGRWIHGSILLSNESEVGTRSQGIEIVNNIISGSANRPVLRITSNAMGDYTSLVVSNNLYDIGGGVPQFYSSEHFNSVGFSEWLTRYTALSGRTDNSRAANPLFATTTGSTPLSLQPGSPAINTGRTTTLVTRDFIGTTRPQGGAMDVGAYEY